MVEAQPRKDLAGPTWWQRCAGLMAIVLVFSLFLEGSVRPGCGGKTGD